MKDYPQMSFCCLSLLSRECISSTGYSGLCTDSVLSPLDCLYSSFLVIFSKGMWKWRTMPSSLLSVHRLIFAKFVRWPSSNALMTISITEFLTVMIQAWPCSTEDTVRDHLRKGSFSSEALLSMCHSFNPVFNLFCAAEISDSSIFPLSLCAPLTCWQQLKLTSGRTGHLKPFH